MALLFFIIKAYIVLLLFRYVATRQELNFNPLGKTVAMLTDPAFKKFRGAKEQTDRFVPALVGIGVLLAALIYMLFTRSGILESLFATAMNFLKFFMMFFIVSVLLGSLVNKSVAGPYMSYFFRLGLPWVKLTRTFVPISSGKIIYPAAAVIFLVYVCAGFLLTLLWQLAAGISLLNPVTAALTVLKSGLLSLTDLLFYLSWLIIARALLSWVSPDVRNPVVQLIYAVTEPVLAPLRRIIPPLGIFDMSALVAILALSFGASLLRRLIMSVL